MLWISRKLMSFMSQAYDRYLADYDGHTVSTIYEFQKVEFQADCHDMAVKEVFSR